LVGKGTDTSGPGSLRAGALTALSLLVVSGVAAVTGVLIAHEFGRSEQTDGLLAAYGLVIVIIVAAQAIRVAVLAPLARAAEDGRLAGELAGYALALLAIAIPLVLFAEIWAGWFGSHLIGNQSPLGQETAAEALKWMVPAGALQLFAGLAASGLAALDDYGTAAIGYGAGSAAGLALIVWRAEPNGIVSVAWGTALNAAIALAVPACWLTIRAHRSGMPRSAVVPRDRGLRARFGAFGVGVVLPIAQQLLYVVTLPFAARVGPGSATTFVYAYLAAAALVTVTAGSLGLVTTVPLSRVEGAVPRTVRHVVSASWLALVLVGAAAGAFAVAGGEVVQSVLGSSYRGNVGADVGRVFVWLSPWMIASVGVAVTFPLTFVAARTSRLPWIALGALVLQIALATIGVRLLDLDGLALALGCSTVAILVALLADLGALAGAAKGLGVAALAVTGTCIATFAPPALLLGSAAAAATGLALYVSAFAVARPKPLVQSWRYLRALR
jgi:peptidoglycan biosynthesis protein MviN/MurJ (putative lipid II flippase)